MTTIETPWINKEKEIKKALVDARFNALSSANSIRRNAWDKYRSHLATAYDTFNHDNNIETLQNTRVEAMKTYNRVCAAEQDILVCAYAKAYEEYVISLSKLESEYPLSFRSEYMITLSLLEANRREAEQLGYDEYE